MISNDLKQWKYYKDKIPLYLKSSYGMLDHFQMIWGLLSEFDDKEDLINNAFDIMSLNVKNIKANNLEDTLNTDVLDKIGNLLGLQRYLSFDYIDEDGETQHYDSGFNGLSNIEFLRYIQIQILNQKFDGSVKSLIDNYRNITIRNNKFNIPIYFITDEDEPALCHVYLIKNGNANEDFDEVEEKMFLGGLYTIKSLGIKYQYYISLSTLGVWNYNGSKGYWNQATWG